MIAKNKCVSVALIMSFAFQRETFSRCLILFEETFGVSCDYMFPLKASLLAHTS